MSWHWIIDDPNLGPYEKLVLLTIRRKQFGESPIMIRQDKIAQLANISRTATQDALSGAEAKGCLEVERRPNHASSYRVKQKQGLLFSNANFHTPEKSSMPASERRHRGQGLAQSFPQSEENPVEISVTNGSVSPRGEPPGLSGARHTGTFIRKCSVKPKDQNPPAEPADVHPLAQISHDSNRRRIEARDRRVYQEVETLQETLTGSGPSNEIETAATLRKIARRMDSLRPISPTEWERRKEEQKQKLSEYLTAKGARP